jgi:hypothetical protein
MDYPDENFRIIDDLNYGRHEKQLSEEMMTLPIDRNIDRKDSYNRALTNGTTDYGNKSVWRV